MPRVNQKVAGIVGNEQSSSESTDTSVNAGSVRQSPRIAARLQSPQQRNEESFASPSSSAVTTPRTNPRMIQTGRPRGRPANPPQSSRAPPARNTRRRKQASPKKDPYKKIIREIKHYQKTTNLLVPRAPFSRTVREVLQTHGEYRMTGEAFVALHESAEVYLTQLFEDSYRCTIFRRAVTLHPRDIQLVMFIRGGLPPLY